MVEVANVAREKLVLGTALSNALRAAKDRSLEFESQRNLDARIDRDRFADYFSEALGSALKVSLNDRTGDTLTFTSDTGKLNDLIVTLDFRENTDSDTERTVTEIKVKAESAYKFKTKYLRWAEAAGEDVGYTIASERNLVLSVRN